MGKRMSPQDKALLPNFSAVSVSANGGDAIRAEVSLKGVTLVVGAGALLEATCPLRLRGYF